jgi:hypothetical protein
VTNSTDMTSQANGNRHQHTDHQARHVTEAKILSAKVALVALGVLVVGLAVVGLVVDLTWR